GRSMTKRFMTAFALLFATACDPGPDPAGAVDLAGHYELSNHFDLTTAGVLPDIANDTLRSLSGLKDNPAHTIISLLAAARSPTCSTSLGGLPDVLKNAIEGWFNDYVFHTLFNGVPVTQELASLIDDIASIATRFEVVTPLDLPAPNPVGDAVATHSLSGIAFTLRGNRTVVLVPELVTALTRAGSVPANAVHIVERSPKVEQGILHLGDHSFGVPLGAFLVHAVDMIASQRFGGSNLREALGNLVNCDMLAHNLASRCVGPVCLGHEN